MIYTISSWVTHSRKTVELPILPPDQYLYRATMHVTEAFNASGTDTVTVGSNADTDGIVTSVDVSTTGIKTCTLGVRAGYGSAHPCSIFYTYTGTAPTTGKALLILETLKVPTEPQ